MLNCDLFTKTARIFTKLQEITFGPSKADTITGIAVSLRYSQRRFLIAQWQRRYFIDATNGKSLFPRVQSQFTGATRDTHT